MNTIVFGLLRGDEGKGKIVDYLSPKHDIVVRFQGGPNAGHTIYRNNKKCVLHQIPSGILNGKECLIGHGCIVDPKKLINEINMLIEFGFDKNTILSNLKVANGCHVIFNEHIIQDTNRENAGNGNGSTKCGISPCYRDKYYREGKRLIDVFGDSTADTNVLKLFNITNDEYLLINSLLIDDTYYLNYMCKNKDLLFEGAQGVFLDIDNPLYPNVSSSSVSIGGVITGTGINGLALTNDLTSIGIVKAYMSSVGVGKFLTEIRETYTVSSNDKLLHYTADQLREAGNEYGATTGRPRKVGFLDLPMVKYACDTTGITDICLTRIDTLMHAFPKEQYDSFPVCVGYAKLINGELIEVKNISWFDIDQYMPIYKQFNTWDYANFNDKNFNTFIKFIEHYVGVQVSYISIGKHMNDLIDLT